MFSRLREILDNFSIRWAQAREARAADAARRELFKTPRLWRFVNANGPGQSLAPRPMSHDEAVRFCRDILGHAYVQTDFGGSIVFFAGPKSSG